MMPMRLIVIVLLWLGVMFQMLGVPGTLLSPRLSLDFYGTSLVEGLSIVSVQSDFTALQRALSWPRLPASPRLPLLALGLFHHPVA